MIQVKRNHASAYWYSWRSHVVSYFTPHYWNCNPRFIIESRRVQRSRVNTGSEGDWKRKKQYKLKIERLKCFNFVVGEARSTCPIDHSSRAELLPTQIIWSLTIRWANHRSRSLNVRVVIRYHLSTAKTTEQFQCST